MEFLSIKLLTALLMPPASLFLLFLLGWWLLLRQHHIGRLLMLFSGLFLLLLSLPIVTNPLLHAIENVAVLDKSELSQPRAQAIVILGGGRYSNAPEYFGDTTGQASLERVRYGAFLHKTTKLPILVTGGSPFNEAISEAHLMKQSLEQEFNVPVKWIEALSNNTWENAKYSAVHLKAAGVKAVYLVSHAWHIPRAKVAFEQQGFTVIPAPTAFTTRSSEPWYFQLIPSAGSLSKSKMIAHELMGRVWYALRY